MLDGRGASARNFPALSEPDYPGCHPADLTYWKGGGLVRLSRPTRVRRGQAVELAGGSWPSLR